MPREKKPMSERATVKAGSSKQFGFSLQESLASDFVNFLDETNQSPTKVVAPIIRGIIEAWKNQRSTLPQELVVSAGGPPSKEQTVEHLRWFASVGGDNELFNVLYGSKRTTKRSSINSHLDFLERSIATQAPRYRIDSTNEIVALRLGHVHDKYRVKEVRASGDSRAYLETLIKAACKAYP